MEPTENKMKIYLGEFFVIDIRLDGGITIDLGKNVYITIYLGSFEHNVIAGDKLPLFTELGYAYTRQAPVE